MAARVGERLSNDDHSIVYFNKSNAPFAVDDVYVRSHLTHLAKILWEYPHDSPIRLLGDMHWLDLLAAWFHAVDQTIVRPGLEEGKTIIVDGWYYKYVCRFALKPSFRARALEHRFSATTEPDLVLLLDADPRTVVQRRDELKPSESGFPDASSDEDRHYNFIEYQAQVRERYVRYAANRHWTRIPVGHLTEAEVAEQVLAIIEKTTCSTAR